MVCCASRVIALVLLLAAANAFQFTAPRPGPVARRQGLVLRCAPPRLAGTPPPPASQPLDGQTIFQLGTLAFSAMLVQTAIGAVVPVLPAFAESIGLSATGVGLVISLPSVAKVLLNLPVGTLVDRWGRKGPMIIGALIDGCGSLATACSRSLGTLVPARMAVGAGSALMATAEQAYVMDVVERYPEKTGLLLGSVQAVGMLGWAVGPAIGGILAERGGIRLPYLLIGGVLIASAGLYALLPETRQQQTTSVGVKAAAEAPLSSARTVLADRAQQALCVSRFGLIVGWCVWLTVVPLQAAAVWGATASDLGLMYSALTLIGLGSAPVGGVLADRFGHRRVAAAAAALGALAVASVPFARGKAAFWCSMAAWDVAESAYTAAASAMAADVTSAELRGASNSMLNQVQDVTFGALPLLLGALAANVSNAAALLAAAALMLSSSVGFLLLSRGEGGAVKLKR